jgi:hypothetical protein
VRLSFIFNISNLMSCCIAREMCPLLELGYDRPNLLFQWFLYVDEVSCTILKMIKCALN